MKLRTILAERMKELRKAKKWSQTQLAKKAGVSQATVSRIATEFSAADIDALDQIAGALGVHPEELISVSAFSHTSGVKLTDIENQVITLFRLLPPDIKGQLVGELTSRFYALTDGADKPPRVPGALVLEEPIREKASQHRSGPRKTPK